MGKHKPAAEYEDWINGVRERMRLLRESLGLTFRAAGERTGVPYASIARVEAGRVAPTLEFVYSVAVGYGVPVAALLCESAEPKPKPTRKRKGGRS